jgi:hypothetical protein
MEVVPIPQDFPWKFKRIVKSGSLMKGELNNQADDIKKYHY